MKNLKVIDINDVYDKSQSIKEISFVQDLIFWIGNIQNCNKKNNAVFVRPFKENKSKIQNLTGENFLIKSSFHGYGGKSYKCIKKNNKFYLIWIDKLSKSLWSQTFKRNYINELNNYLISIDGPKQLTKSLNIRYDSNFVIVKNKFIGLFEQNDKDYLFSVSFDQTMQDLKILKKFDNFAGSLCSNAEGDLISWIEWKESCMPWEKNSLNFGIINPKGELSEIKNFKEKNINESRSVSFFQPVWISNNILVCSEDSSGWWNLLFLEVQSTLKIIIKKRIQKRYFEYGLPQWISGISLFSGSVDNFFALAKYKEKWLLEHYQNLIFRSQINLSFTSLKDLHAVSKKIILKGSNDITDEQLIEIDTDLLSKSKKIIDKTYFVNSSLYSRAQSLWFKGFKGRETHAWIYEPKSNYDKKYPLMIKAHSGPTSNFEGSLNLEVQFWTSRGWLVAEVNYGGSSGYGKDYRKRLDKKWGIVDSEDCRLLAEYLLKMEVVDPLNIIICGNSAGGFTAINSLYKNDLFKAAICKYPVLDLMKMRINTHRFEKNYLNYLIGSYEKNKKNYFYRSPINNLHKITKPVLLFHGKQDSVINYVETLNFHQELSKNNKYCELHLFEDEGHGFKDINNKIKVLSSMEIFLKRVLRL